MTDAEAKQLVLVTGANGYIGARIIGAFLDAGYSVRGTVRSKTSKSASLLCSALEKYMKQGAHPHFELVEVPDITESGAFDHSLSGVTSVVHLAQPVSLSRTDAEYMINTAVQGVESIATSVNRILAVQGKQEDHLQGGDSSSNIKTFVLMSSIAAIVTYSRPGFYSEDDWNDEAESLVQAQGSAAGGLAIYAASKTAAERALWKAFQGRQSGFTATALNPVLVAGPPLALPDSPDGIGSTTRFIWDIFSGHDLPTGPTGFGPYVDVRDVARMAVFAVQHPEIADGQRYIVGGGITNVSHPQAAADILRAAYPERKDIIREGMPGKGYLPGYVGSGDATEGVVIRTNKAVEATGSEWIPYEKTVLDTAAFFQPLL